MSKTVTVHYAFSEVVINDCQDCPYASLMSIDCKALAYCNKACTELPANGKGSEELMVMAIPGWCPLEDAV